MRHLNITATTTTTKELKIKARNCKTICNTNRCNRMRLRGRREGGIKTNQYNLKCIYLYLYVST